MKKTSSGSSAELSAEEELVSIKEKFNYNQSTIQRNAIQKLNAKLHKEHNVNNNVNFNKSYKVLLEAIAHPSVAIANAAVDTLFDLVKNSKVTAKQSIADVINLFPQLQTANSTHAVVGFVASVLSHISKLVQLHEILNPIHPFITLYKLRPESWGDILYFAVPLFEGFHRGESSSAHQYQLHQQLAQLASSTLKASVSVLSFLCSCLPCYQIQEPTQITFASKAFQDIVDALVEIDRKNKYRKDSAAIDTRNATNLLSFEVATHLSSFILHLFERRHSLQESLHLMKLLFATFPSLASRTSFYEFFALLLMLVEVDAEQLMILGLIDTIVRSFHVSNQNQMSLLPCAMYPLLRIVSSPNSEISKLSSTLLSKLETLLPAVPSTFPSDGLDLFQRGAHNFFSVILNGRIYLSTVFQGDVLRTGHPFTNWLLNLSTEIEKSSSFEQQKLLSTFVDFIIGLLFTHPLIRVRAESDEAFILHMKACLHIISSIASRDPFRGINFLPLLLHQISNMKNEITRLLPGELYLEVLNCIASLAVHEACVGFIFRLITPLFEQVALIPVGLRLMLRVWLKQDRTFGKLRAALQKNYNEMETNEVKIAKALTVCDVCAHKPEKGLDLIALLSGIFNAPDSEIVPVTYSIGIRALHQLCVHDVLEFRTAWGVVAKKLNQEQRPLIAKEICKFLGNGTNEEIDPEDEFILEVIQKLWNYAQHTDALVRVQALKTLSLYAKANFDIFSSVDHEKYISTLDDEPSVSTAAEEFVTMALENELNQRRRVIKLDVNPNEVVNKTIHNVGLFLAKFYQNPLPSLRSGSASALLWSYRPPVSKGAKTKSESAIAAYNGYKRNLTDLLNDVDSGHFWASLFPAWISFMKRMFDAAIESVTVAQSESVTDTLFQQLVKQCKLSPAVAENAIFALAGLALALPPSVYQKVESITETLTNLSEANDSNERVVFASNVALGCVAFALQASDLSRYAKIVELLSHHLSTESEWTNFGSCVGLGLVASALFQTVDDEIDEKCDQERKRLLHDIIGKIKQLEASTTSLSSIGYSIGMSYASSSLEKLKDTQELHKLFVAFSDALINEINPQTIGATVALPTIAIRCFRLGLITNEQIHSTINLIEQSGSVTDNQNLMGLSSLLCGLAVEGYYIPVKRIHDLISSLISSAVNPDQTTAISAILGLSNLVGCEFVVPPTRADFIIRPAPTISSILQEQSVGLDRVVEPIKLVLDSDADDKVKRTALLALGAIAGLSKLSLDDGEVPQNLDHLPSTSLIRSLFSRSATYLQNTSGSIKSILNCFNKLLVHKRMPAVNWVPVLQRVMKGNFGVDAKISSYNFAIEHVKAPTTNSGVTLKIVGLLSNWTEVTFIKTLTNQFLLVIISSLPVLLSKFSTTRSLKLLNEFYDLFVLEKEYGSEVNNAFFVALGETLKSSVELNIQPTIISKIHDIIFSGFDSLESPLKLDSGLIQANQKVLETLDSLLPLLSTMPLEIIEPKLALKGAVSPTLEKNIITRSNLVATNSTKFTTKLISAARSWCFSEFHNPKTKDIALAVMPFLNEPLGTLNLAEKKKWLSDTFDSLMLCTEVGLALHFIGLMGIQWNSAFKILFPLSYNTNGSILQSQSLSTVSMPTGLLPETLPSLLLSWQAEQKTAKGATEGDQIANVVSERCLALLTNTSSPLHPSIALVLTKLIIELKNRNLISTKSIPWEALRKNIALH